MKENMELWRKGRREKGREREEVVQIGCEGRKIEGVGVEGHW